MSLYCVFFSVLLALLGTLILLGCQSTPLTPALDEIYSRSASAHGPERNPVIVVPGILGSRLVADDSDGAQVVWGAFTPASVDPRKAEDARLLALPMRNGAELAELKDGVRVAGALDRLDVSLLFLPIRLSAYANILQTLGAGGYMDEQLALSGAIDYGDDHYSCFQFAYDWRRDNVENARELLRFIEEKRVEVQANHAERFGGEPGDYDVKFDIVAHSMGGLIARYMLRYGGTEPAEEGETPVPTWAGTAHVERLIVVGTPNAGSASALEQLVLGAEFAPIFPSYPPALLGTMPSIYQLLPRGRHGHVVDTSGAVGPRNVDPLDVGHWQRAKWGLADPRQDPVLQRLLPDVADANERRIIALDHLSKCLERARRFHAALDVPATPPAGTTVHLFAGDAVPTAAGITTSLTENTLAVTDYAPGDGTVTRASALMDERVGGAWTPRLVSPVSWHGVTFLHDDHLGLTKSVVFSDNVLFLLLEQGRGWRAVEQESSRTVD